MSDIVERLQDTVGSVKWPVSSEMLKEAATEILRLRAENAKVRSFLRWDIVEDEEGLIICDGDHEKGEKCDHRRLYWQSTVDALRAENEKLRAALKLFQPYSIPKNAADTDDLPVLIGDLRAAADALKETGDE